MTPSERTQRWRENNREKYLEGRRRGYQLRRERGVCNECGRPSKGLAVCRECLGKRKTEGQPHRNKNAGDDWPFDAER